MATQVGAFFPLLDEVCIVTTIVQLSDFIISSRLKGEVEIKVPLSNFLSLSKEARDALKVSCGRATGTLFGVGADVPNNTANFFAIAPLPIEEMAEDPVPAEFFAVEPVPIEDLAESPASANATNTNDAASTSKSQEKVKRPKNAFVLFRLDNHKDVQAKYPGIHNNDISKVVASRWNDAAQDVKDHYKELAAEEKRQHAIDHPGYQYQPRKPSEKKKRMTKNKLAKMAAKASSTDATTNAAIFPAQQGVQTMVDTFMPPYQNDTSQLTMGPGPLISFNVVADAAGDDDLRDQLALLNPPGPQLPPPTIRGIPVPPAIAGEELANGAAALSVAPFEDNFPQYDDWELLFAPYIHGSPSPIVKKPNTPNPYAEQDRQEALES